jgi:hypothetical protein
MRETSPWLPPGYRLEQDPDLLVLRRSDGSFVAAFSVRGFTKESVEEAAERDLWERLPGVLETRGYAPALEREEARPEGLRPR